MKYAIQATVASFEFKAFKVFEKIAYVFLQYEFWKISVCDVPFYVRSCSFYLS